MPPAARVVADYRALRLSLAGHPVQYLRSRLAGMGISSCAGTSAAKAGTRLSTAGIVLVRQRPGKGNAIFITLEDETGITNVLLWARLFERQRRAVMAARLMRVDGEVQRSQEGIVHLMATTITDLSGLLDALDGAEAPTPLARADEVVRPQPSRHPRDARVLPKSRDFH
jgi:error-prone DNA polymerase